MEKLSVDIHVYVCKVGPAHPYCNIYTIGINNRIFYSSPHIADKTSLNIINCWGELFFQIFITMFLDWLHILMQVIFSGAIDWQTDTRYVGEETAYLGNEKKQQPQLIYDYLKTNNYAGMMLK